MKFILTGLVAFGLLFGGCKKSTKSNDTIPPVPATPSLYLMLFYYNTLNSTLTTRKFLKDGIEVNLTGGFYQANGGYLNYSDRDTVIVNSISNGSKYVATLWKNGVVSGLTDGTKDTYVTGSFISGNDVYVIGRENTATNLYTAKYWKNGVATTIATSIGPINPTAIWVSGTDIYVALTDFPQGTNLGTSVAKIWKNGVLTTLSKPTSTRAGTTGLTIAGNDVYVTGVEQEPGNTYSKAVYWKNGVAVYLSDGAGPASTSPVYIFGTDIYLAGAITVGTIRKAVYWKNGTMTALTDGTRNAGAGTILVNGADLYIAGSEESIPFVAGQRIPSYGKLWKNGVVTNFTDGSTIAALSIIGYK